MSVADKIKKSRKAKGWSQQELADKLGVSRVAIVQWENPKKTPANLKPDIIVLLSKLFGVNQSAFTKFGGDTVITLDDRTRHAIPLLSWEELKHIGAGGKVALLKDGGIRKPQYLEVAKETPKSAIAFILQDDSMSPTFNPGDEIVIDPQLKPDADDCVLVRLKDGSHIFRKYRSRGNGAYDLVAENPDWDTVSVTSRAPAEILGTMVERRHKRRKR